MASRATKTNTESIKTAIVAVGLSLAIGAAVGAVVSGLIAAINWATFVFTRNPKLALAMPAVGLLTVWIYRFGSPKIRVGLADCWQAIHSNGHRFSTWAASVLAVATILTHGVGGSAGREGTAVQIGAVLSDRVALLIDRLGRIDRRMTLLFGIAAGFSAAIGTPWVGGMFAIELYKRRLPWLRLICIILAAHVSAWVRRLCLGDPAELPVLRVNGLSIHSVFAMCAIAVVAAALARFLVVGIDRYHRVGDRLRWWWVLPVTGGLGMAVIAGWFPFSTGLGLNHLRDAFWVGLPWHYPIVKWIATVVTVGSGFKGGEFIPLVWIGASTGSIIGGNLGESVGLSAAVGYLSAFVSASNMPLTGIILAVELFGWSVLPWAILACGVAALMSDPYHTIYRGNGRDVAEG